MPGQGTKNLHAAWCGQQKKRLIPPSPLVCNNRQTLLQRGQRTQEEMHKIPTSLENQCYQTPLMAKDGLTEPTLGEKTHGHNP